MRTLETTGWLIFGAALGVAFAVLRFDGPKFLANGLIVLCFLVALPLMFMNLRRRWRAMRGD